MVLKIEPFTDSDIDILLTHPSGDDLVGTPLSGYCWPLDRPDAGQRRLRYYTTRQRTRLATDPSCRWVKCVDETADGKCEIVSLARWHYYPGVYDSLTEGPKDRDGFKPSGTGNEGFEEGEVNWELFDFIVQTVDHRADWVPADGPIWMLLGMTTRPSYRRRGAASMLVEWGVEQARKTNAYAGLEASAEGRPVYEKYGFKQVAPLAELDCRPYGIDGVFEMAYMVLPRPEVIKIDT